MFKPFTFGDFWTVVTATITGAFTAGLLMGDRTIICKIGFAVSLIVTIIVSVIYIKEILKQDGNRNDRY